MARSPRLLKIKTEFEEVIQFFLPESGRVLREQESNKTSFNCLSRLALYLLPYHLPDLNPKELTVKSNKPNSEYPTAIERKIKWNKLHVP